MKLNQIYIKKYGPVQKDLQLENGINVIRGPNESGKSLLVEALQKQLVDGSVPEPVVSETPEGFVEISGENSAEALQKTDSLTDFCDRHYGQDINSEELRNVFVIRKGDLTFHERDDFYSHITDRLTGRRVEDIDEVTGELVDEGRITPRDKKLSNKQEHNKAEDQRDDARSLRQSIEEYVQKAKKDKVDRAEADLFETESRIDELEERKNNLEKAKEEQEKRTRYEDLKQDKELVQRNLREMKDLPDKEELEDIDSRLEQLSKKEGRREEIQGRRDNAVKMAKLSAGAGLGSFALLIGLGSPLIGGLAPLGFVAASGYFWKQSKDAGSEIAELDESEAEILSDARAAGIKFEDREEIRERISNIKDRYKELEEKNQEKFGVLKRELGFKAETPQEVLRSAGEKLEELEAEIDDSIDLEFDEDEYRETVEEFKQLKDSKKNLENDLEQHRRKLREFRNQASELDFRYFTGEGLNLEVNGMDALEKLEERLEEFISEIEQNAEASRKAIEIFEEIQEEEKEETAELFEEGSRATELFREITDARYTRVTYDSESNRLKVEKSTGETYEPELLSDGTKDQLYLSIRVALGEKILEGNQGFFVMDDAFITSDASRIEKQAEVVEKLVDEGWQIIYLSSKEDAISALSERTDNELKELSSLE